MKANSTFFITKWGGVITLIINMLIPFNSFNQQEVYLETHCKGTGTTIPGTQNPWEPADPPAPEEPPVSSTCSITGEDYINKYRTISHYENTYDNQAVKTIRIALHLFRDNNGNAYNSHGDLVWQNNADLMAEIDTMEGWMNQIYADLDPSSEIYANPVFCPDAKIRIKIMDVYFYENTTIHNMFQTHIGSQSIIDFLKHFYPERLKYLPVCFVGIDYTDDTLQEPRIFASTNSHPDFQTDGLHQCIISDFTPDFGADGEMNLWGASQNTAHEIGHVFGLYHLYNHAPLDSNNVNWVHDLFNYGDFWCAGSAEAAETTYQVCYDNFRNCDPWANDGNNHCANNLMSAVNIVYDDNPNTPRPSCCGIHITPGQIGKIHRNCHVTSLRKYMWGYTSKPYEVTTDETWDFSIKFYQDIVVKKGVTLTVKCDVQMVPQASIIVEPGGTLIIDGGTIRNATYSDGFWQGIQIWGNSNDPHQNTNYQGRLLMYNGATIKGAQNAIRVWKVDNWNTMGGVVRASDSWFVNNRRDVEFMPYSREINGTIYPNRSVFKNCTFYWDDKLMSAHPQNAHVTMYKTEGIVFVGCDFEDRRTSFTKENSGSGIFSLDAKFKVLPRSTITLPPGSPQDAYYDETNYDVSTFKNLRAGVHAMDAASQNTVIVERAKFLNCFNGIILSQVDNAMLTRNAFYYDYSDDNWMETSQTDIVTDQSSAYQIEGNLFYSEPPNNSVFNNVGVSIYNSGASANQVYKNKTYYMGAAVHSYGQNHAGGSVFQATGLQFLCNEYNRTNLIDQYIQKDPLQTVNGARYWQGSIQFTLPQFTYIPTGNTFNQSAGNIDIRNGDEPNLSFYPMRYVYFDGEPNEKPVVLEGNVSLKFSSDPNLCPSSFTSIGVGVSGPLTPVGFSGLVAAFQSNQVELSLKRSALNTQLILGDNQALYNLVSCVNPFTKFLVKSLLATNSPYLSERILKKVADKSPMHFSSEWLKNLVIANIEVTQNTDLLDYLASKTTPLSNYKINEIRAHFGNLTQRGLQEADILRLKTKKVRIANMIIKDLVQDSVGADKAAFQEWVIKRGDVFAGFQLADDLLERGEKSACSAILDSLNLVALNLPEGEIKNEFEQYIAFKRKLITLTNERGFISTWNKDVENVIRGYIVKDQTTYAGIQAKNLLCYFTGQCKYYQVNIASSQKSLQINQEENNKQEQSSSVNFFKDLPKQFVLYPNPAENKVNLHIDGLEKHAKVVVTDLSGRVVLKQISTQKNELLDLSQLGAGIYNVQVIADGKNLGNQKLIVK